VRTPRAGTLPSRSNEPGPVKHNADDNKKNDDANGCQRIQVSLEPRVVSGRLSGECIGACFILRPVDPHQSASADKETP
jgi:hypothetical protein